MQSVYLVAGAALALYIAKQGFKVTTQENSTSQQPQTQINPKAVTPASQKAEQVQQTEEQKIIDAYKYFAPLMAREITLTMILKMWTIESSRGRFNFRPEKGLALSQQKWSLYAGQNVGFDDASLGGLQVLTGTANWLYTDMGYRDAGRPTLTNLNEPRVNTYFAMAYLDYLAKRAKKSGKAVTEKFLVMSYNGGYGADNAQTRNHYSKYLSARGL